MIPWPDIVLFIFLIGFLVNGYRRGFIQTLGQLTGAVIGFFIAKAWSPFVLDKITPLVPLNPALTYLITFILIFALMEQAISFVFDIVNTLFKVLTIIPFLSTINSLLGAVLGVVAGVVTIGGAAYLIMTFRVDPHVMLWINQSRIATLSEQVFRMSFSRWL